mgnify:FL=1
MEDLILATGNNHKAEEFAQLLDGLSFQVRSASFCGGMPTVTEDGTAFAANADLKATALRAIAPANAWVLADDSGLEVDALDGAPGIFSARYAGPGASDRQNLEKLLAEMRDVPGSQRTARFRCVLCLIDPHGHRTFYDGICNGQIATQPTGTEGFGYDPIFIPDAYEKSLAELGESVKSRISHRAKAVEWLRSVIEEVINSTP